MRRLAQLFTKDMILGAKDVWVLLEVMFAVVVVLVLLFVVPEDIETESTVFIYDKTALVEGFVETFAPDDAEEHGEVFVDSREAVVRGMVDNRSAVGLVIEAGTEERYSVEMLTQPYTTEALVQYIEVDLEDLLSILAPPADRYQSDVYGSVRITALQEGRRDEIPFNQRLLPIVILFEVGIVGLFAMGSILGQERGDKTIRAMRVSPTGLGLFLTSKHLVMIAISIVTFSIIYLPMMGFSGYLLALLVVLAMVLVGSALGTIIGGFFADPMTAFGWFFVVMVVLGLPSVSLMSPAFSPNWLKIIPSYHALYGMDAAMFPDDNAHLIWNGVLVLAGFAVVLLPVSGWIFVGRVRKEA